jgi:hypothetical protein
MKQVRITAEHHAAVAPPPGRRPIASAAYGWGVAATVAAALDAWLAAGAPAGAQVPVIRRHPPPKQVRISDAHHRAIVALGLPLTAAVWWALEAWFGARMIARRRAPKA